MCYAWGAKSENRSKIGDFAQRDYFDAKFQVEGSPHQSFLHG